MDKLWDKVSLQEILKIAERELSAREAYLVRRLLRTALDSGMEETEAKHFIREGLKERDLYVHNVLLEHIHDYLWKRAIELKLNPNKLPGEGYSGFWGSSDEADNLVPLIKMIAPDYNAPNKKPRCKTQEELNKEGSKAFIRRIVDELEDVWKSEQEKEFDPLPKSAVRMLMSSFLGAKAQTGVQRLDLLDEILEELSSRTSLVSQDIYDDIKQYKSDALDYLNKRQQIENYPEHWKKGKRMAQDFEMRIPTKEVPRIYEPRIQRPPRIKKQKEVEEDTSRLRIELGRDVKTQETVYWDPYSTSPTKLTNQHILIVGKSGSGKTQSVASFIDQLASKGVPSIIFDFQGEYPDKKLTNANGQTFLERTKARVLDAAAGIDFNPLSVPIDPVSGDKQSYMKVVYQVSDSLGKIFDLGDIQTAVLQSAMTEAYEAKGFIPKDPTTWDNEPPTMPDLWEMLLSYGKSGGNLNFRIKPLFENDIFVNQELASQDLFETTSILKLSNLSTQRLMVAVSQFMLQKIYMTMLSKGMSSDLRCIVVIDEAHKLAFNETISELVREGRKYGVGILLASHSVTDFNPIILNMAGTKVAMQLGKDDATAIVNSMGFSSRDKVNEATELVIYQKPSRALVTSNHYQPFVHIDTIPFWQSGKIAQTGAIRDDISFVCEILTVTRMNEGDAGVKMWLNNNVVDYRGYSVKQRLEYLDAILEELERNRRTNLWMLVAEIKETWIKRLNTQQNLTEYPKNWRKNHGH